MSSKIYISDFCEDLNYHGIILYIGSIDSNKLLEALKRDNVNHCYRFSFAISNDDPSMKNFIYIENCDLQNLDYPIYEYIEDGYDICWLYEDDKGFYIKRRFE